MSATEPEGKEIYLVTVGRHAFGSGASLQEPNTIRDAEDRSEGFDDDPSTPLIDEAEVYGLLEADAYYVNGGYKYPTQGVVYRTADTLASDPIHLPPSYIYGGTSPATIDQNDPLQCHMLLEFWPEGYAKRPGSRYTRRLRLCGCRPRRRSRTQLRFVGPAILSQALEQHLLPKRH